jgi:two-component system OmpR family response regulator
MTISTTSSGPLVLVVDDDPHIREVMRFALERAGLRVREAPDGRAALESCAREPPAVVVLDIMMPEMDGIETCRRARKMVGQNVPILFLTAADSMETVRSCLEAGGDDYLMKQGSPTAVVERVNRLANVNRSQLQNRRVRAAAEVRANMATFPANPEHSS